MLKLIVSALILFLCSTSCFSQDRYFAKTYTSDVLPKGSIDLEFWHTSRFGHSNQFYNAQDQRMELEFGLGKNLQTSVYFNRFQTRLSTTAEGTTVTNEIGFSNEWKWKLSDPAADKIGSALYAEWGVKGGDELELEAKLILDKNIGKSLIAFNGVVEYEKEFEWSKNKVEAGNWALPVEFALAYQYFARPNLGIGLEINDRNNISKANGYENSVIYAGPTLRYTQDKWFIILNYQPQIANVRKTATSPFSKELNEYERGEARFIVGISL